MTVVCYLDDSDGQQSSVATLAGYIATVEGWQHYESHSRAVYDTYRVGDLLHAKEFQGGKTPFRQWSWPKRLSFIDALFEGPWVQWGVAVSISKREFAEIKNGPGVGPNMSPYGLAFSIILHTLVRGTPLGGLIQAAGLEIVVEDGHRNNGDIARCFEASKRAEVYAPVLRAIGFATKKSCRALHLADLLAFYSRRRHSMESAHPTLRIPKHAVLAKITQKVPHTSRLIRRGGTVSEAAEPTAGDSSWLPVPLWAAPARRGS